MGHGNGMRQGSALGQDKALWGGMNAMGQRGEAGGRGEHHFAMGHCALLWSSYTAMGCCSFNVTLCVNEALPIAMGLMDVYGDPTFLWGTMHVYGAHTLLWGTVDCCGVPAFLLGSHMSMGHSSFLWVSDIYATVCVWGAHACLRGTPYLYGAHAFLWSPCIPVGHCTP